MPTSRATRVTSDEKPLSWSTIVLMVSFSSRISPFTSTVILRDRSPRATAVVTVAMLRTCAVRLVAIALTESVRSFHVPATPGTTAWPPRRPSVPTSRATRVTSDANERSWSTIVLMASLSCRISPRTSTVIFLDRSPLATAIVTSAMLRTCAVRLPAIWLTESVSSFQTPDTPFTCAWPPSLPSVPTSRATRVTSEVNTESCSIIVFTSFAERRNSPLSARPSTSSSIDWPRSPFATAPMVRATSVVGRTRSSISVLSDSTLAAQPPMAPGTDMRCRSRPSLPTVTLRRVTSRVMRSSCAIAWLNASAMRPSMPAQSVGSRTPKSPSRNATIAVNSWRARASGWLSTTSAATLRPAIELRGDFAFRAWFLAPFPFVRIAAEPDFSRTRPCAEPPRRVASFVVLIVKKAQLEVGLRYDASASVATG